MGLFGPDRVVVSSVAMNLAGDYAKIPNYLKGLILGNIVATDRPKSIPDLLQSGYANGPGSKLRRMHRWANLFERYNYVGIPQTVYDGKDTLTQETILTEAFPTIPDVTMVAYVDYYEVGQMDPFWWAYEWACNNYVGAPAYRSWWSYEYLPDTGQLRVDLLPPHPEPKTEYIPLVLDRTARYLYARIMQYDAPIGVTNTPLIYRYKAGSGKPSLDVIASTIGSGTAEVYPYIPLRQENQFLSESNQPLKFKQAQKAYRRVFNQPISKLMNDLAANENIGDMDHAYVMFGVSSDTQEPTCKEYLFKFFQYLRSIQFAAGPDYADFVAKDAAYRTAVNAWLAWDAGGRVGSPPAVPEFPQSRSSSYRVYYNNYESFINVGSLNIELSWRYIGYETGTGLKKPGAKVGEVWFDVDPTEDTEVTVVDGLRLGIAGTTRTESDTVRLYKQTSPTTWEALVLVGMTHRNYVYRNHYTEVRLRDSLQDPDESGFIVPLHKEISDSFGLINFTQMTSACCYLVINCYKIVKASLLAELLSIAFFVAAIVLIVVMPPAGGLLGSNLAVGSTIGLTATAAVLAGAVINAIAAMIVTRLISMVAVEVFGDKLGAIIGAVVGFVAVAVGSGLSNGMDMSAIWSSMGSAQNLMALTSAVGSGVSGYVQAAIQDLSTEMGRFNTEIDKKMAEVQALYAKNIGYGNAQFDAMSLTDTQFGNFAETSSQFLNRTLLTGTDIAEISLGMISSFTDLTTQVELPHNA